MSSSSSAVSSAVGMIPARLGSTRFPGKVLADKTGKPLIQHVYEAARRSKALQRIVIATDDQRVARVVVDFGGEAVLTSSEHPNGTSRLGEAAAKLGLGPDEIIVNIQGDEPELDPATIDAAVGALLDGEAEDAVERGSGTRPGRITTEIRRGNIVIATAAAPFAAGDNPDDPNCVKVVCTAGGATRRALYFSRSKIPFVREGWDSRTHFGPGAVQQKNIVTVAGSGAWLRHVGIYVYRRLFLEKYLQLSPTPLEQAEQLEQLRVLEHGYSVGLAIVTKAHAGIDTLQQYEAFVDRYGRRSGGVKSQP